MERAIITYSTKDVDKLTREEIKTEVILQRYIASVFCKEIHNLGYTIKKYREEAEALQEEIDNSADEEGVKELRTRKERKESAIKRNTQKLEMLQTYDYNLRGYISVLEERKPHARSETTTRGYNPRTRENKSVKVYKERHLTNRIRREYYRITKRGITPYWNREAFDSIAKDRGYFVKEVLISNLAEVLELTYTATEKLLKTGRFTWEEVLIIGVFFEMTPREFSMTFLHEYFTEVAEGIYRAWGDTDGYGERIYKNA